MNLPNGGSFIIQNGGLMNLSAQSGNGFGGNFTLNMLGGTGTVNIAGTLRSNGLGTGQGGTIILNGSSYTLSSTGMIQALGGTSGGNGGIINLTKTAGSGTLTLADGFDIHSNGVSTATQNYITITADSIRSDGLITADGITNSAGGKIVLTARNGRIQMYDPNVDNSKGDLYARGNGTGTGGTIELRAGSGATALDIDEAGWFCLLGCSVTGDSGSLISLMDNTIINVTGGGGSSGTIQIGRATSGTIIQNMNSFGDGRMQGSSTVEWGNDGGNTTSVTLSNYDRTTNFNGSNPTQNFYATGNITATANNNFGNVRAQTGTGNISITDYGGLGMSVLGLSGGAAGSTHTIIVADSGPLTLQNATANGTVNLQTANNITATTGNALTGTVNIMGQTGVGSRAGTVNFSNGADTVIGRVTANTATLGTTGAGNDLTITNLDVSTNTTLNSAGNITADSATNNFGSNNTGGTLGGSGVNVAVRDNAGTFNISGLNTSGTLTATAAAASNIVVNSSDVTGTADIQSNGGGSITGTGNTFRGTANLNTNNLTSGNVNVSGDFQGNTTLYGNQIDVTDTAGNLTVTGYTSDSAANTLTASAVNGDATVTFSAINAGGAGKLTVTANKEVTLTGAGGGFANSDDTLVANSTNVGNIHFENITQSGVLGITSGTAAQTGPSAGLWAGTNGGTVTLANVTQNGNVSLTTNNANIVLGQVGKPVAITGTTAFSAGTGHVSGEGSYTGAVSGTAGTVGFDVTSGNFTSGGITASAATNTWNTADESLVVQARSGDILGTGYTTSGAADIRLQAGTSSSLLATNNINVNNVVSGQNLRLYATGDSLGTGSGTAVQVAGTSSVAGHITATGLNASNQFAALNGNVDITLNSGNLTTALIWTGNDTTNLTTNNGSILQNTAVYGFQGKTIWTAGPVNLTAQGGASRYIDTGVMTLTASGTGGNITAKASGDSAGNGTGISISLRGRADGTVTATNLSNGNTTGDVYLGTSIGVASDLDDAPTTVMDVMGATTIKSAGNVKLYGGFFGPISVTGKTVTGTADKGNLHFTDVTTTATSGTGISLTALQGKMTGGNLATAGSANIFLQAGSLLPRDKLVNINLTNVTAGGNIDVVVAGSTDGTSSGQSVVITGSKGGTSSATKVGGGAPLGTVSMP